MVTPTLHEAPSWTRLGCSSADLPLLSLSVSSVLGPESRHDVSTLSLSLRHARALLVHAARRGSDEQVQEGALRPRQRTFRRLGGSLAGLLACSWVGRVGQATRAKQSSAARTGTRCLDRGQKSTLFIASVGCAQISTPCEASRPHVDALCCVCVCVQSLVLTSHSCHVCIAQAVALRVQPWRRRWE